MQKPVTPTLVQPFDRRYFAAPSKYITKNFGSHNVNKSTLFCSLSVEWNLLEVIIYSVRNDCPKFCAVRWVFIQHYRTADSG
jgi:hypothetical protein